MPLIKGKSKKSFEKNVSSEMEAGKPQDQSLAIAYSVQKKAKKKMARGGMVPEMEAKMPEGPMPSADDQEDSLSVANRIMKRKKMSDGGMVDLAENGEEEPNFYDQANEEPVDLYDEPILKENYDSNLHGDAITADEHDMISKIRERIKSRRGY